MLTVLLCLLPAQVPAVESKDFSKEVQQTAVTATVRIANVTEGADGSGVLLRHEGPHAYVLTANHVVGKAKQLRVHVFTAGSYPREAKTYQEVKVLARDARTDLAVLQVTTRDKLPAPLAVCPLKQAPAVKGFAVLALGCRPGEEPRAVADTVQDIPLIRKPGEPAAVKCWETAKAQGKGRSGGPLLDRQGRVLGVASGTSGGRGYYTHLRELHEFLKDNALEFLAEAAK
jgi:S1-C subfamily serine protease